MLYLARDRLWDLSRKVSWLEGQPYYEREETVERYDASFENVSTFRRPTSHKLIELMKLNGAKSVLDIGCGAGAFYSLLTDNDLSVRYKGVDASAAQVKRATKLYGERFEVMDASLLSASEISSYDAIHVYSVFPFMSVDRQLRLLGEIVKSEVLTVLEIGATKRDFAYIPSMCFRNLGKARVGNALLLTAVSYPMRKDVESIYPEISWQDAECSAPHSVNLSGKDGGAIYQGKSPRIPKRPRRMKMFIGEITQRGR